MTYLDFVNRVLLKAREDAVTDISSDTTTKAYFAQLCVLDAIQDLAAQVHLKCLRRNKNVTTSAGTVTYDLGSQTDHVYNVTCDTEDSERKLSYMNQDELDIAYPDPDDTSLRDEPYYYTEYEWATSGTNQHKYLKVYPCPDGIYNLVVRYYKKVSDMSASTDVPEGIDVKFHPMIVELAYAKFMQYKKDEDISLATMLSQQAIRTARKINRGMLEGKARMTLGNEITRIKKSDNPLESDL